MKPANPEVVRDKCIGCGLCMEVCPAFVLDVTQEKARVLRRDWCIGCGQCGAICPVQAITFSTLKLEKHSQQGAQPAVTSEALELFMRERRSVRIYEKVPIPDEFLRRILDAGKHAPTGRNSQNVHYIVLKSPTEIDRLRKMTLRFYEKLFSRVKGRLGTFVFGLFAGRKITESLRESLPKVEYAKTLMEQGKDCLFYHAPVIMVAHAESWDTCSAFNCSVGLYHCSLMAQALRVGCCFNGYLVSAINHSTKIKKALNIPRDHQCFAAMTLGFQKLRYTSWVEREPPTVVWR